MIRPVGKPVFARSGDVVTIVATLKDRVDEIGNYSLETANEGGFWGAAIPQLPASQIVPKGMQMPSYSKTVHAENKTQTTEFPCLWSTWVRVVQYLPEGEKPSISAKLNVKRRSKANLKEAKPPEERSF